MIVGAGVDLEEVDRVRTAIERHGERFLGRVHTPEVILGVHSSTIACRPAWAVETHAASSVRCLW